MNFVATKGRRGAMSDLGWYLFVVTCSVFVGLLIGFTLGTRSVEDHCKDFAAFHIEDRTYDCRPK